MFGKNDYFLSQNGSGEATWLIPNSQKNDMEPILLVLPEGGESDVRYPFEGEEFGYVLEGRISVVTDGKEHVAKRG